MSGSVGSAISKSGMVENVGVAVGIASPTVSVQELFPLPVSTSGFVADTWVSDVGRCRAVSAVPYLSRAWSKMWKLPLESRRNQLPFKSYFQFRFCGRHLESPTLCDIYVVVFRSAVVENVGVAVGIMSVCCWKLKLGLHRPAENLRFFCGVEGAASFSVRSRYWKELSSRGKRQNIRNWTLEEQVLTFFLNSHGSQNYSKKKHLHPFAVRGLIAYADY